MHLYCENEWARDLIQSIFGVGSMCGLLVMNLVSDTKSRKLAILLCFLIVFFGLSSTISNKFSDRNRRMGEVNRNGYCGTVHTGVWDLIHCAFVLCVLIRLLQRHNQTEGCHYCQHRMVILLCNF